jgi:hypothetical protein
MAYTLILSVVLSIQMVRIDLDQISCGWQAENYGSMLSLFQIRLFEDPVAEFKFIFQLLKEMTGNLHN